MSQGLTGDPGSTGPTGPHGLRVGHDFVTYFRRQIKSTIFMYYNYHFILVLADESDI